MDSDKEGDAIISAKETQWGDVIIRQETKFADKVYIRFQKKSVKHRIK